MQPKFLLLFMVVAVSANQFDPTFDYCKISPYHTLCRYNLNEYGPLCGTLFANKLTEDEERDVLTEHIKLRTYVYEGFEGDGFGGPQPKSSSNPEMVWDDELAKVAQGWANQCTNTNDEVRDVSRFNVGQNVFQGETGASLNGLGVKWFIRNWYGEVKNFKKEDVESYSYSNGVSLNTLHYSQLVWANSTRLGCAGIKFRLTYRTYNSFLLVCNYGKAGNIDGHRVYDSKPFY